MARNPRTQGTLQATVAKALDETVRHHVRATGVSMSQWLGTAAELNIGLEQGRYMLFDRPPQSEIDQKTEWAKEMGLEVDERKWWVMCDAAWQMELEALRTTMRVRDQHYESAQAWEAAFNDLKAFVLGEALPEMGDMAQAILDQAGRLLDAQGSEIQSLRQELCTCQEERRELRRLLARCEEPRT
jgi:hypothetical protein